MEELTKGIDTRFVFDWVVVWSLLLCCCDRCCVGALSSCGLMVFFWLISHFSKKEEV